MGATLASARPNTRSRSRIRRPTVSAFLTFRCSPAPNKATSNTPLDAGQIVDQILGPGTVQVENGFVHQLLLKLPRRSQGDHAAMVDHGHAVAVLGLFHVVGGDEDRAAASGHVMDQIPEAAPAQGVHARWWARPGRRSAAGAKWRRPAKGVVSNPRPKGAWAGCSRPSRPAMRMAQALRSASRSPVRP